MTFELVHTPLAHLVCSCIVTKAPVWSAVVDCVASAEIEKGVVNIKGDVTVACGRPKKS